MKAKLTLKPCLNVFKASLFIFSLLIISTDLYSDQNDPRLNELFIELKQTENQETADQLTDEIWAIWRESPNKNVNQLMVQGRTAMSQGRLRLAVSIFDKIIEIAPDFAEGWNKRATVYYFMEEYEKSLSDVRETLKLEPRHFGATAGLGLIFLSLEFYDEALVAFERTLEINPHLSGPKRNVELLKKLLGEKSA